MSTSIHVSLGQVAASLALVALAAAVSFWRRTDLERDIGIAALRSFVQLTAIGYAIKLIFEADTFLLVLALLSVMVLFGALTARSRAKKVPAPSGRCWSRSRRRARRRSAWSSPSASSNRPRATWSRSAGW